MISLKQLRYFDAVAREGAMGRAAERCFVTQPALSMQIQELERRLGTQLLERVAKGVRLTEAGREVAERARAILLSVEDLMVAAEAYEAGLRGALRLGVIPTVAPYLLPAALKRWRDVLPELRPEIRESQTETLVRELLAGELDAALVALPVEHGELESLGLFEDRFLAVEPAPAPLQGAGEIETAPAQLQGEKLLLLEEGHCLRDQTLAVWPFEAGCEVSRYGASSLSTLVQMSAGGMGVTLIPEMSVPVEAVGRSVRLSRFAEPEPRRLIGLVWRRLSPRRRAFEAVAELFREARSACGFSAG